MAQCATTALAGAVPRPCVRGAHGRFGGLGLVPGVVSPPFPPSRLACPALCVAGRPVRVSLTLARLALKMSHASTYIMNDRQKPQNFQNKPNTQQRCVNFVNHLDRIRVLATLCPVRSKVIAGGTRDPELHRGLPPEMLAS